MGKAVRLDRFLADSGAGTRTEVKKLIQKGMVQVNGEKVKKPELKIDPETDVVELCKCHRRYQGKDSSGSGAKGWQTESFSGRTS